jgi:hypothetical protein
LGDFYFLANLPSADRLCPPIFDKKLLALRVFCILNGFIWEVKDRVVRKRAARFNKPHNTQKGQIF